MTISYKLIRAVLITFVPFATQAFAQATARVRLCMAEPFASEGVG
jgi:hypothetical protein